MSFAPVSFKAADSLPAYRIVKISAANTVNICTASTDKCIGVTVDDATAANQAIPVAVAGVVRIQFNETCAAGNFVMANTLGMAIPAVATTAGVQVIGVCLGTVAATGTQMEVLLRPFEFGIP